MKKSIIIKLQNLTKRYTELEFLLSNNYKKFNKEEFFKLSKEKSELFELNELFVLWLSIKSEIKNIKLLLRDSVIGELAEEELCVLLKKKNKTERKIETLLIPIDPYDKNSCFIEIRAATGGLEAAIFSGELCKMYMRYADLRSWKVNIINMHAGDQGGYKVVILKVIGIGVCKRLKFESGGHRVQRVPQTESQGRIHTSTCTVAIMPEAPKSEKIILNTIDLKIDTFRSSGAGGQHVNTTDSAVRITHLPTGNVVECQDERSQHKNKEKALSVLSAKIYAEKNAKKESESSLMRKNLLGTGSRSDRNRTYNFPQNRVTDHRINLTLYRLNEILSGKLDLFIDPLLREYQADLLLMTE
ncbi:Peptide chain release factor RF1 [Buchnera aphidicola (Cinara kochiana kochiana)]|uniref:Peptide chain release factor 1 n=1 Tax=Buchnera aphidicola (Cinara kochiana kochiana) TaxID=2518976 RepID=A0A451D5E4_9GAMM|nr:peptide chain release factor 1 [Buchnera aphidicola]VFP81036.1 Peptide chain release factor RF1 [Buchnera aphidicola (Cinara kochiana kochiana)]